jgi:hypothetical protein
MHFLLQLFRPEKGVVTNVVAKQTRFIVRSKWPLY